MINRKVFSLWRSTGEYVKDILNILLQRIVRGVDGLRNVVGKVLYITKQNVITVAVRNANYVLKLCDQESKLRYTWNDINPENIRSSAIKHNLDSKWQEEWLLIWWQNFYHQTIYPTEVGTDWYSKLGSKEPQKGKIMTNDNLNTNVADGDMALAVKQLEALYDAEGNLIVNPTQEDFEEFAQSEVDTGSTLH